MNISDITIQYFIMKYYNIEHFTDQTLGVYNNANLVN